MTHVEFRRTVATFCDDVFAEIVRKNEDYAGRSPNPFNAFDTTAQELGVDRELVWAVFWHKHVKAAMTWARTGDLSSEDIKSRLIDIAAYAAILYASIVSEEHHEDLDDRG